MKKSILKVLMIAVFGGLLFTSCNNDESSDGLIENEVALTEEVTMAMVESDDITDEVDNLVEDFIVEDYGIQSKEASKDDGKGGRPECAVRTIEWEGTTKTLTVDFGEGCELPNGHVLSGKIIMVYEFDKEAATINITQTFEDFYFNDVAVTGENTMVRTRENENGNPETMKTMNVTHTWPDGEFCSRVGVRTKEMVEGVETKTWGDNVFLITGSKTITFKDGNVYATEITTALRREMACRFIVSGVVEITKGDKSGTLDFGDGTCDNVATFTNLDGETSEITLRKKKR